MTLFTLGRALFLGFMTAFTVNMSSALEIFDLFVSNAAVMTGGAFFDFLAFYIGNLSAMLILAVMTLGAFNVFLVFGMVKLYRFFTAGAQGHGGGAIVSHGGYAEAHQKG